MKAVVQKAWIPARILTVFWGVLDQLSPGLMTDPTGDFFSSDISHLAEKGSGVSKSSKVNQSTWKRFLSWTPVGRMRCLERLAKSH